MESKNLMMVHLDFCREVVVMPAMDIREAFATAEYGELLKLGNEETGFYYIPKGSIRYITPYDEHYLPDNCRSSALENVSDVDPDADLDAVLGL